MNKMNNKEIEDETERAHFVLVHGASHGAWCWYKVRTQLEEAGHTVTCVDLKGAGINLTDPKTIFNFNDYNEPLLSFFSTLPECQKVILVGHSVSGFNITQALFKFTTKIRVAVYLAATMMKSITLPFSSIDTRSSKSYYQPLSELTKSSLDLWMFDWTFETKLFILPTSMIMKKQYQRQMYYNMSPLEDCTLASMLLRPTPVLAVADYFIHPEGGAESEVDKVPRVYIKTLHDHMIQSHDAIISEWPPNEVLEIDSDHSAFFSNPTQLFQLLLDINSKYA